MSPTQAVVVTRVCNEQESHERGTRYWNSVEIHGKRWFQIETCEHTDGEPKATSFITPDFKSIRPILSSLRGQTWTVLRLYSRMPLLSVQGFIFESITKVFATEDGSHVFLLESGLMLHEHPDNDGKQLSLSKIREVYSSGEK